MTDSVVESTPKCGCGKSLHMPYCDGSHGRSPEQYEEWKRQTELEKKQSDSDQ
jgi:CDGSH-type Zn-finger protein